MSASNPAAPSSPWYVRRFGSVSAVAAVVGLLLAVGAASTLLDDVWLRLVSLGLIYASAAIALNLAAGYGGLLSFGHAALMGVGGYTYAILTTTHGWSPLLAVAAGGLVAAAVGAALMLASVRVRGTYFALITLAFGQIFLSLIKNGGDLTGGPSGVTGVPPIALFGQEIWTPTGIFLLAAGLVTIVAVVVKLALASRWGDAVCAVGQDEIAARGVGVRIGLTKVQLFALSAGLAGVAGTLMTASLSVAAPSNFDLNHSILLVLMVVIGGLGSVLGSIAGAIILVLLDDQLQRFVELRPLVLGAVLVLVLLLRPHGAFGAYSLWVTQRVRKVVRW